MINVVGLAFQGVVLSWVMKLEKACGCSERWQRSYIKWYAIASILLVIAAAAGAQIKNKALMGLLAGAGLVNIYAILSYIPKLKYWGCSCASSGDHGYDFREDFIYWWTLVGTLLMLFFATSALLRM
jgi:hypothetical protein